MTDREGNRKISGNSQLFPGPPESLEPDGFLCWPRDQSLFVLLYHYCALFDLALDLEIKGHSPFMKVKRILVFCNKILSPIMYN